MKLADVFAKKKAKEVTPKQELIKTIFNWVLTILCIVLIVFALVVAIFTIVRSTNGDRLTTFGNKVYMNVMSDSMKPTFSSKDVIIADRYKGDGTDLKVGMVVTFHANIPINGKTYDSYNTHRIVELLNDSTGKIYAVRTKGDNAPGVDAPVAVDKIVATWGSVNENGEFKPGKMLKGVGAFSNWIQDPEQGKTRFFCVIVLPLIVLFIAYAFVLVRTLVIAKLENNKNIKGEPVPQQDVDSMSDEEKRRLAQKLLASLQASTAESTAEPNAPETPAETPAETSEAPAETSEAPAEAAEAPAETAEQAEPADTAQNSGEEGGDTANSECADEQSLDNSALDVPKGDGDEN